MGQRRKNTKNILARINFPLYTVQMLTNRYVIVGGGGGTSKTGVANGFEIFELSHDGIKFIAEEVTRHETGGNVVMYSTAYSDNKRSYVVAGQESHCQLYNVNSFLVTEDEVENIGNNVPGSRQRNINYSNNRTDKNRNVNKRLKFAMSPGDSIQTDFDGPEPLSRVARISHNGKLLATGGTDGVVRLWKFPSLQPLTKLKAHSKEIDDIDFSQYGNYLVTVAKDGFAILWDCVKGKEHSRVSWKQPEGSKYMYKRCRFGKVEGEEKSALYTLTNPTGLAKKQKSYLQQWLPDTGALRRIAEFDESICALAVRDDGRFVAVGTMFSGSVAIYASFSLQRILNVSGAHSMFVTGLEFLPVHNENENQTVSSVVECAVLSISVDNHVCIHTLPYRRTMPVWVGMIILLITLFITFMFCSYLGL